MTEEEGLTASPAFNTLALPREETSVSGFRALPEESSLACVRHSEPGGDAASGLLTTRECREIWGHRP